jgi:NADH dehydrogenase
VPTIPRPRTRLRALTDGSHRVVIVGGGFGGLYAARALRRAPVSVTLVDRRNFHLFQPLLYQVATGALSPANIAAPLRSILKRQKNTEVLLGEAVDVDVSKRRVILRDGEVPFDTLMVAAGVTHSYFGHDAWESLAPGLKTIEDATEIRRRVLLAFEAAERETDPWKRRALLTFVVVGGGPTGVELAGALGEISHRTLRNEFRLIDPSEARILLIEGADRVLPTYAPPISVNAVAALGNLHVEVASKALVTDIREGAVVMKRGEEQTIVEARTVLWAAGIQASPLGAVLARATGARTDRAGRIRVGEDLTLPDHPEIFVLGDLALLDGKNGKPLPGVAQVAMQEGKYAARTILRRLSGKPPPPPFRYLDFGSMATIGRGTAVAEIGPLRLSGSVGWLVWLFIHLMYIVQFGNRLLILLQWAWSYVTWNRSARLITGRPPSNAS